MANEVMTDIQYNLIKEHNKIARRINDEAMSNTMFEEMVEGWMISPVDDIDIFNRIERYQKCELNESAVISVSNNMAIVIIEAESDYVFGFFDGNHRNFFLSEVEYKENEDGETEPVFIIGDNEQSTRWNLGEAMRIR